jgi:tRNA A37 threonylcarbamoyladenosine dehydratase
MSINPIFERLAMLIGNVGLDKLQNTSVLVFGAGGVGSWAAEALVRSGIGKIGIIDNDTVCASNVNRQIQASNLTLGLPKASTLKKRLLEINPQCKISAWDELFCLENASKFEIEKANYVIDAIDILKHKLDLIETVTKAGIPIFSSMGMASKMDPSKITTGSIWKTDVCSLARLVRQGLRKRGFNGDFITVSSKEPLSDEVKQLTKREDCRRINGSMVTVTATAGLMLASLVIKDAISNEQIF